MIYALVQENLPSSKADTEGENVYELGFVTDDFDFSEGENVSELGFATDDFDLSEIHSPILSPVKEEEYPHFTEFIIRESSCYSPSSSQSSSIGESCPTHISSCCLSTDSMEEGSLCRLSDLSDVIQWEVLQFAFHAKHSEDDFQDPELVHTILNAEKTFTTLNMQLLKVARRHLMAYAERANLIDTDFQPPPLPHGSDVALLQRKGWKTGRIHFQALLARRKKFVIQPQTLVSGPSNRFYRHWGSNRFIELNISEIDKRDYPSLQLWLMGGQKFLSRTWRLFYIKGNIALLFATDGEAISEPVSIWQLVDWHIPFFLNQNLLLAKFWNRISLGLSNTTPSLIFTENQLVFANDIYPPGSPHSNLTDGCAAASPQVFQEIRRILNLCYVPTAVQGRIGAAKGVWFIDPTIDLLSKTIQIQIRKSQMKFMQRSPLDPERLTLDVIKVSRPATPSELNCQLILVLTANGVPREAFIELFKKDVQRELVDVIIGIECNDIPRIRHFIEKGGVMQARFHDSKKVYEESDLAQTENPTYLPIGLSCNTAESCIAMLESGFLPSSCRYLAEKLKLLVENTCKNIKEKMHLVVQKSTTLLAADPLGILKEGQVSIRFAQGMKEETGWITNVLVGDVLLARNPALLPTDIQKAQAVDCPELRLLTDVVVFSIQGNRSLISILSGGDYDGDMVWICWDDSLVHPFRNADLKYSQPELYILKDEYFNFDKRTVADVIGVEYSAEAEECLLKYGLETHFAKQNELGSCCNLHERYVYNFGGKEFLALQIGHLASYLIDAAKLGMSLLPHKWNSIRNNVLTQAVHEPLWWSFGKQNKKSKEGVQNLTEPAKMSNILDVLYIVEGPILVDRYLAHFNKAIKDVNDEDEDIETFWTFMHEMGYKEYMDNILKDIQDIKYRWSCDTFNFRALNPNEDREKYNKDCQIYRKKQIRKRISEMRALKPRGTAGILLDQLKMDLNDVWQSLTAAGAWITFKGKKKNFPFEIANFGALMKIKAEMLSRRLGQNPRYLIRDAYFPLRVDKCWTADDNDD